MHHESRREKLQTESKWSPRKSKTNRNEKSRRVAMASSNEDQGLNWKNELNHPQTLRGSFSAVSKPIYASITKY